MKRFLAIVILATSFAAAQEWEYASLLFGGGDLAWVEPGVTHTSTQPALLLRDMTGSTAGATDDFFTSVLNAVGADGWELISQVTVEGATRLIFKRSIE